MSLSGKEVWNSTFLDSFGLKSIVLSETLILFKKSSISILLYFLSVKLVLVIKKDIILLLTIIFSLEDRSLKIIG